MNVRLVAGSLLLWASVAAAATDFQIGPDAPVDSLAIAGGGANWLVVWRDTTDPNALRVTSATVSATGVVSAAFVISDVGAVPQEGPVQRSTVAFDGTNYLVVWSDARVGSAGIRGALVSGAGAVIGADSLIATVSRTNDLAPQVVFSGTDYLVAWQDAAPSSDAAASQIRYTRVSTAGAPGVAAALPFAAGQNQALEFLVNGPGGEALIVHQDLGATPNATRATRIAADGSIAGPAEGTFLFQRDFETTGLGAPIGAALHNGEYVVLSSYSAQIDSSVFKTRLLADGSVVRSSAPLAEVGQGTTGLAEDAFPRTCYNGTSEFLFVRNIKVSDIAYHLMTKRVAVDGTDNDPNPPLIDTASQGVLNGATAAALGTQYLVVWMDGRRSGAQPARQLNVYGFLIDGTKPGDDVPPFLKAVAHATPQFGSVAQTVTFWPSGSTGIVDAVQWNFGDGTASTLSSTTHKYETQGEFVAVLSLVRAGYVVRDFVRIFVDVDTIGGGGGPPQAVGGTLGPVSDGVNTVVIPNSLVAVLNFTKTGTDALRFSGYIDPSVLPVGMKDQTGSLIIGDRTYTFTTTVDGLYYTAAGVTPSVRFFINRYSGGFVLNTTLDDLRDLFGRYGATDETIAKPGRDIAVPVQFTFAGLTLETVLTANYTAKAAKSGRAQYWFGIYGYPSTGYFRVFAAKAVEGKVTPKEHAFTVTGNFGPGGSQPLVKAASGNWRITLGNYIEDIPTSALTESNGTYTYAAAKGRKGISGLYYNSKNGAFVIGWKGIAAEGNSPSGMPLATSPFSRADLAFSVDLDADGGAKFQASGYVRFGRTKLSSKKWKLR